MTPMTKLTCRDLVELVSDYIDGHLSPADRARFDEHIDTCDGCTAYLDQMRQTIRLTGALREDSIPPAARRELLGIFRDWGAR